MSMAKDILEEMLQDQSGEMLKPERTTRFATQQDGSLVRTVFDSRGEIIANNVIADSQSLALSARASLGLTQQNFASLLGISVRTLHDWEQGRRQPSGAAKTLLRVAAMHPQSVRDVMQYA